MYSSYSATLVNHQIIWGAEGAPPFPTNQPVHIKVTLVESPEDREKRGLAMAAIMEEFAARGGPSTFGDPVEWQREQRKDRPLPGRDE